MTYFLNVLLLLMTFFSFYLVSINAYEFQVGNKDGWKVPSLNDTKFYNDWASENRFKVDDTIRFRYKKDSVMLVNEADYKKCDSSRPMLFSNTGNTVYKLDRSGPFYFISGASGHCERGQRMIVKVMSDDNGNKNNNPKIFTPPLVLVLSFAVFVEIIMRNVL